MINSSLDRLDPSTLTVPISLEAHQQAQQLCHQQRDRQTIQQIYLNVLAVSAVRFYLQCMGIDTNWDTSQSADPVLLTAMNTADLDLVNLGKLECRPVLPDQGFMHVPPEVWGDRLGYVAVRLDDSLRNAVILGFIETVTTSEVPLSQLQPLDDLLTHLNQLQIQTHIQPHDIQQVPHPELRICLSRWLENLVDEGWRSLESLLGPHPNPLAVSFRTSSPLSDATVKRAKLLDLGVQIDHQSLALLIAITPTVRTPASADPQDMLDVLVQLHPGDGASYLPSEVQISLHSESGDVLQDVRSRQYDNYIQLKRFRGTPGECFDIQVSLGTSRMVEKFVI